MSHISQITIKWNFHGGPVVKTSSSGGVGSIPGVGTKIPQAVWCGQKKKKKIDNQQGVTV